jgi:crossover junction endodeoxyribonuclease RuvC
MRVLGLDPGLRHTGWGLSMGRQSPTHVAMDSCMPGRTSRAAMRLESLFRQITAVIERFHPDEAAVEETFVSETRLRP